MITFDYTGQYDYTCRDCEDCLTCNFTKKGTLVNRLPCMNSKLAAKPPKVTNALWDYEQLIRQLSSTMAIIKSSENEILRECVLPPSFVTGIFRKKHSLEGYIAFRKTLKSYFEFLRENEELKDNKDFIFEMIQTKIRLEDNEKITVVTTNLKLKKWFGNIN